MKRENSIISINDYCLCMKSFAAISLLNCNFLIIPCQQDEENIKLFVLKKNSNLSFSIGDKMYDYFCFRAYFFKKFDQKI